MRPWNIEGLGAQGPDEELRGPLALFGQFVGDWDIVEAVYPQPDGTEIRQSGEVHMGWVLAGRALQDVWMKRDEATGIVIPIGTTIRVYHPKREVWEVTWIPVRGGPVQTLIARQKGPEIVLEGSTPEGEPTEWIFSDVTPMSFRWRAVVRKGDGDPWRLTANMKMRRQDPARSDRTAI